jgi:putative N6-adenine-specific DNA methylase
MTELNLACPCLFGLESVLSGEIKRMGGRDIQTTDGRVTFKGDWLMLARANLMLRTAERVLILLGEFEARSFTELFDGVYALPWENFIGKTDAFPVKGWSLKSQLHSIPDCQSITKKAIAKRLGQAYGQSWLDETGPELQVQFSILKDKVSLMIDTSGTGLYKRGYRQNAGSAPIKETLAAGIVDLARVKSDSRVYDPFCGSGTLLIEAALKALRIPSGVNRRFAGEHYGCIPAEVWAKARAEGIDGIQREAAFRGYGSDIDPEAIALVEHNRQKVGVGGRISAKLRDIDDFVLPEQGGIVLCNPPYGERMLELKQAEDLYKRMGKVFQPAAGMSYYIIAAHPEFETLFGRKATKRRKLYNGMLKCQLYMYY